MHETIDYKIKPAMYPDFFDDIYTEEYAECIAHLQYAVENESRCGKLEDCKGRYYNVTNGKRHTVGQPTEYRKTIYFIGPCFIYGHYVEDKNTIESLLQKIINDKGYNVKVENCGSAYSENIMEIMLARIKEIPLKRGDVVVIYSYNRYLPEVSELNLMDVIERSDIKIEWMVDHPFHCNHKLNKVYAEAIFHELQPALTEKSEGAGLVKCEEDFVKTQYIDLYFSKYDLSVFKNIGSIVMNCNPFTFGHRYLIEKALEYVDFLIIFVVEEDRSLFSFIERFTMISEGVKDLDHVMVVPSGPFILSQTTFPEYFIKMLDENIGKNIKNDVSFFGERIAPLLNIKYRFVGEEPEDPVTNEYNKVMERLLPEKGVKYIEIPRKMAGRGYISASKVRKILELNDKKMIKELVPQSTMQLLFLKNM